MTFCNLCFIPVFMLLVYWPFHFRIFIAFGWQLFFLLCSTLEVLLVHSALYKLLFITIILIIVIINYRRMRLPLNLRIHSTWNIARQTSHRVFSLNILLIWSTMLLFNNSISNQAMPLCNKIHLPLPWQLVGYCSWGSWHGRNRWLDLLQWNKNVSQPLTSFEKSCLWAMMLATIAVMIIEACLATC